MAYRFQTLYYSLEIGGYVIEFYRNHNDAVNVQTKDIGDVVKGVSLTIQGQQDDIDAPIIKTSLALSFIDASDINNGLMNGPWDFFAKAEEKEWYVMIERQSDGLYIWSGYITPDSYSEEMVYRGTCSIIARDNIGQLQNYDFDAEGDEDGMISMRDLVDAAWQKIDNGMELEWVTPSAWLNTEYGTGAPDTLLNVSAFEGKSWYDVLESVLYSYGAVLRYAGLNNFIICPLRYLPCLGKTYYDMQYIQPEFMVGATREFTPAVKQIEESVKYELEEDIPFDKIEGYVSIANYHCSVNVMLGEVGKHESAGTVNAIRGGERGWTNVESSTLFFDVRNFPVDSNIIKKGLQEDILSGQYIAANNTELRSVSYIEEIKANDFEINIEFGNPITIKNENNKNQLSYCGDAMRLAGVKYSLCIEQNDNQYYLNEYGFFGSEYAEITQQYDETENAELPTLNIIANLSKFSGLVKVIFTIHNISYIWTRTWSEIANYNGIYAKIRSMSFKDKSDMVLCSASKVKTIYNNKNNLILSRSPEYAPAMDSPFLSKVIKNGIFERRNGELIATREWILKVDEEGNEITSQLAAGIHMQLLPYFTQPNEVLNGTILNAPEDFLRTIYLWGYHQEHILISGTLNLANGYIEGAVLREFARYEDVWEGAAFPEIKDETTRN